MLTHRLSGTALFYSLLISTLVGLMLTALVAFWVFYKYEQDKDDKLWQQLDQINNTFEWLLAYEGHIDLESSVALVEPTKEQLIYCKQQWGLFDLIACAFIESEQIKLHRTALVGTKYTKNNALILEDGRKPLALAGGSQIVGNATVPSGGIRTAVVSGKPFTADRMVVGETRNGGGQAPSIQLDGIDNLYALDKVEQLKLNNIGDSLSATFFSPKMLIKDSLIVLKNKALRGAILIEADSLIRIDGSCYLENVILKAPIVEIASGFNGQIQIFASEDITIAENVQLNYPSCIVLKEKDNIVSQQAARLRIGKNSEVNGFILGLKGSASEHYPSMSIDQAIVRGGIHWQGAIEAKGELDGYLYARNFFYQGKGTSFYFNYMVDFIINRKNLSKYWVAPNIYASAKKSIALCLD